MQSDMILVLDKQTLAGWNSIGARSGADLQPNKSETVDIGAGVTYSSPIDSITVAIDFVEFEDGITWGPDIGKTKERLDSMRAGSRAAIGSLIKLMKTDGLPAVISILETESIDITRQPTIHQNGSMVFVKGTV